LKQFSIFLLLFFAQILFAQNKEYWLIDSETQAKKVVVDSAQAVKFLDSLSQNGYYFTQLQQVEKEGNTTKITYNKGKNYNEGYIQLSDTLKQNFNPSEDFFVKKIDSLKQKINDFYKDKGFTFNRIQSRYLGMKNDTILLHLSLLPIEKRNIDRFEIKNYEKVPKRFVRNLEKEFLGKPYNETNIQRIRQNIQHHSFVSENRSPQTLFTKDSTTVYLYLNKRKTSTFDGVIGFGNDQTDKFQLNGTLNVSLENMFNGFEKIALYWQRNPDKGQTFDLETDIPYLFNSNVGFNGKVNIYRQDTLYANVKFQPSLYYNFSLRQKIGIRANLEVSSVLADDYLSAQDYNKKGIGIWYEFTQPSEIELFVNKRKLRLEADVLKTNYQNDKPSSANQTAYFLFVENNFHLAGNHFINLKGESALIHSESSFLENELLRFGGWNSLRGFNEKSLIADFYAFIGGEYRYLIGDQAFFDAFIQLATLKNSFSDLRSNMYSFGLGFNYRLPIGVMSFQISSGNPFGNPIRFQDTKVHWGLVARF